ncbi:hypothetical protein LCGC14_1824050, partial [marine sediment metagenome]
MAAAISAGSGMSDAFNTMISGAPGESFE